MQLTLHHHGLLQGTTAAVMVACNAANWACIWAMRAPRSGAPPEPTGTVGAAGEAAAGEEKDAAAEGGTPEGGDRVTAGGAGVDEGGAVRPAVMNGAMVGWVRPAPRPLPGARAWGGGVAAGGDWEAVLGEDAGPRAGEEEEVRAGRRERVGTTASSG